MLHYPHLQAKLRHMEDVVEIDCPYNIVRNLFTSEDISIKAMLSVYSNPPVASHPLQEKLIIGVDK